MVLRMSFKKELVKSHLLTEEREPAERVAGGDGQYSDIRFYQRDTSVGCLSFPPHIFREALVDLN